MGVLVTQKEKLARVSRRWARWLYSTNYHKVSAHVRDKTQSPPYTAGVAPATTAVLGLLWGLPFPGPVELYRGGATGVEVAHQSDVGVFVQIWVGVKLARDQLFNLSRIRAKDVGQAGELSVERRHAGGSDEVITDDVCGSGIRLA